jgi:hypothetical protein
MHARRIFTQATNIASTYVSLGILVAPAGALTTTALAIAYFGPKGLLQTAGLIKPNHPHDTVIDIACDTAKSIARCTLFGATAWFKPVTAPVAAAFNAVKKHS